jgi:hypothetical protein
MADLRLGRYEIEHFDPPPVCMRCGRPSALCKDHRFQWSPPWVYILLLLGLIPAAIVIAITRKTMLVPVPLCERHKWHWGGRTAIVLLGLVGIFAVMFGGIAIAGELDLEPPVVFIPVSFLFLAWIVSAVVLAAGTIRPREITDKSITLSGVAPEFIEALNAARRGGRGDEDDDRPRRRRRRDEDKEEEEVRPRARRRGEPDDGGYYDPDEAGPRRRPPPDAIEEGDGR